MPSDEVHLIPAETLLFLLSARAVSGAQKVGMHADGAGLYLRVRAPTVRSWVFVWHAAGKRREMGMGSPPYVTLAKARERAQKARDFLADGLDPLVEMRRSHAAPTFGELADEFIRDRTPTVRSDKSVLRWERTIGAGGYADKLRSLAIDKITTEDVLGVLRPIWTEKASTAGLRRGYIEAGSMAARMSMGRPSVVASTL